MLELSLVLPETPPSLGCRSPRKPLPSSMEVWVGRTTSCPPLSLATAGFGACLDPWSSGSVVQQE